MGIFYKPEDGVAADFIPLYHDGQYHLFYLKDYRNPEVHGRGTPWFQIVTRDFVHFEDWGEALPRGEEGEQDRWVFTGSAVVTPEQGHLFYTAHNGDMKEQGGLTEVIAHATSPDLHHWTKDPGFRLAPPPGYEQHDWRDPFVFWNEEAGEWWMLLAARREGGPRRNRGCIALAASRDLRTWEAREPFWAPEEYYTHECPDLFRLGEWWYLVFSTFSDRFLTHYRRSRSLAGPWLCPPDDSFDGRAYYAAKTAGDGEKRYVFGWLPTRAEESDEGGWQWGGHLVVHEVRQEADGTLSVRPPEAVVAAFTKETALRPDPVLGSWECSEGRQAAHAVGRQSLLSLGDLPAEAMVEAEVTLAEGTYAAGLLLRTQEGMEGYYQLRLEPYRQRIVLDRWPRPGDQACMIERPLALTPGQPVRLRVIVDGTCLVAYADEQVALSGRMYQHRAGGLGLVVTEGEAEFRGVRVTTR